MSTDASSGRNDEGWSSFTDQGFIALVGPIEARRDARDLRFRFRAEPKHANLIGVVQGGMLMTFADRALGMVAMRAADGANCVTIQFEMQFIASARMGDDVLCTAEVVRRTASLVFLRGVLGVGPRTIATATGIWKILRRRPGEGTGPFPAGESPLSSPR